MEILNDSKRRTLFKNRLEQQAKGSISPPEALRYTEYFEFLLKVINYSDFMEQKGEFEKFDAPQEALERVKDDVTFKKFIEQEKTRICLIDDVASDVEKFNEYLVKYKQK